MSFVLWGCRISLSFWFLMLVAAAAYLGGDIALLPAAALLHEAGHLAAITLLGGRLEQLTLGLFGACMVPRFSHIGPSRREIVVLLFGPLTGLLVAGIAFALGAGRFAAVNLALSGFNLLPIEGLDGGSLLRLVLADRLGMPRGERLADRLGIATLLALLTLGTAFFWKGSPMPALLLVGSYLLVSGLLRR